MESNGLVFKNCLFKFCRILIAQNTENLKIGFGQNDVLCQAMFPFLEINSKIKTFRTVLYSVDIYRSGDFYEFQIILAALRFLCGGLLYLSSCQPSSGRVERKVFALELDYWWKF